MSNEIFEKANLENDYSDHLRIVLIGKTGGGKSSTANSIVGAKVFKSAVSSDSVTKECEAVSFQMMNQKILLVDTVGIGDTNRPENEILNELKKIIEYTYPGPHIFVIVLSTQRFTNEEKYVIELISNYFGKKIYNHAMIVFTRLDDLEYENRCIDDFVNECQIKDLGQLVSDCNYNFLGINNRWEMSSVKMIEFRKKFIQDVQNIITISKSINNMESDGKNNHEFYTADKFKESVKYYEQERKRLEREKLEEEERKKRMEEEVRYQQWMISQMQNGIYTKNIKIGSID